MKFDSCDCRRIPDADYADLREAPAGTFHWARRIGLNDTETRILWIVVPYEAEHDSVHALVVYEGDLIDDQPPEPPPEVRAAVGDRPLWWWDGNEDRPTLKPSIACGPPEERDWHGYLTAGRLEACE